MGVLIKISFKPIQSELDYIKEWLAVEDMLSETGFYCNWASIVTSFRSNNFSKWKNNWICYLALPFKPFSSN